VSDTAVGALQREAAEEAGRLLRESDVALSAVARWLYLRVRLREGVQNASSAAPGQYRGVVRSHAPDPAMLRELAVPVPG
jgi:hypothetical protein